MGRKITVAEQAFRDYRDMITGVLFRYLRNDQDVEDVLQETFIRAITYNITFDGDANYRTWLIRVAINQAINHIQAKNKLPVLDFEDSNYPDSTAINICSAELCAIAEEELKIMNENIKNISEELWGIFVLVQFEGTAQCDVAVKLKIPPDAVKSRLDIVKKALLGLE